MKLFKLLLAFTVVFALSAVILPDKLDAQYVTRLAKDSVSNSNTKYLTFTSTPNLVTAIAVSAVFSSGTTSITGTLETRVDTVTNQWLPVVSSATFSIISGTGTMIAIWPLDPHYGNGYRIKLKGNTTQMTYVYGAYLRRTQ